MSWSEENEEQGQSGDAPEAPEASGVTEESAAAPEPEPQPEPEVAAAEQAEPTAEAPAEEEPAAEEPAAEAPAPEASETGSGSEKKGDVVPGANLEPIAITEERELTAEERARLEAEEEERASREAAAAADEEDDLPRREAAVVPSDTSVQATGKRKNAVARVLLRPGSGTIVINGKDIDAYFPRPQLQSLARQPLVTAGYDGNLEVRVNVHGGGISGQAGAVRHGLARALCELDPELRPELKKRGMLTRDAREKERRKAGLKKARKRPQFSKR